MRRFSIIYHDYSFWDSEEKERLIRSKFRGMILLYIQVGVFYSSPRGFRDLVHRATRQQWSRTATTRRCFEANASPPPRRHDSNQGRPPPLQLLNLTLALTLALTRVFRADRRGLGDDPATRRLLLEADPAPVASRASVAPRPVKRCNKQNTTTMEEGGGGEGAPHEEGYRKSLHGTSDPLDTTPRAMRVLLTRTSPDINQPNISHKIIK